MDQLDLIDIYRTLHPPKMNFTFFSSAHETFSRIDHILGHKSSLGKFKTMEIISSIFSDHKTEPGRNRKSWQAHHKHRNRNYNQKSSKKQKPRTRWAEFYQKFKEELTTEFYQKFREELTPILLKLFQ